MKIPLRLDEASFLCPITGQVITDPVVDHEGNSYEKTAILEWLSRNQTSPITRSPLLVHQLAPNRILKELLEEDAFNEASISGVCPPSCKVSTQVITSADGHALIQVSVADEKSTSHSPASVICVLDVSGSMTMAATMHNDKEGCGGLSLLDIVKHATRTVIETLSPEDRLSVIAYSNAAQLLLPLTYMTSENKQKAWKAVGDLSASGGTNLWGGLAEAMYIANLEEGDHCHILLLTELRDESEEIFCKLPPPTPSRKFTEDYAPVRSMSAYYQSSVPCFARGDVKLGDGSQVDITELRSGDVVASSDEAVRVKCIVKTYCENGIQELVELDEGVLVTPWHPVREPGASQWIFPYDLAPSSECQCDAVYSFVLDGGTFLQIGPYQGIALGHGITNDPVVEHGYLGTEKVVADLEAMDGWAEGFVVLGSKPCLRDPETGLVVDIVQEYVLNSVLQGRE
jgi:hypothetical protein